MAKLGILGGTFNPPHIGHLACASEARTQLALDRVVLVPVGRPPHKEMPDDPGAEHRLAMCGLMASAAWLDVSEIELRREGPSYTIDTLREIHDRSPGDALVLIVGGDMAWSLPSWREPEAILEHAELAVAQRSGVAREDLLTQLSGLAGEDRVTFLDVPRLDVSSSDVRRRVRSGRAISYLVTEPVADYIEQRRLYT